MKQIIIAMVSLFTISQTVAAQVSADSMKSLKDQKEVLKIQDRINENKIKVAKFENTIAETSKNQANAAKEAQQSANANNDAALDLSNDAQNGKLAKKASKRARQAEKDASSARRNNDKMEKLNSRIADLKKKIAEDEQKLSAMGVMPAPMPM